MSIENVFAPAPVHAEQTVEHQQLQIQKLEKRVKSLVLSMARLEKENGTLKAALGKSQQEKEALESECARKAPEAAHLSRLPDATSGNDRRDVELSAMKISALRRRAAAGGCDIDVIDKAGDSDDPQQALIALIVAAEGPVLDSPKVEWLSTRIFNTVETSAQVQPETASVAIQALPNVTGTSIQADIADPISICSWIVNDVLLQGVCVAALHNAHSKERSRLVEQVAKTRLQCEAEWATQFGNELSACQRRTRQAETTAVEAVREANVAEDRVERLQAENAAVNERCAEIEAVLAETERIASKVPKLQRQLTSAIEQCATADENLAALQTVAQTNATNAAAQKALLEQRVQEMEERARQAAVNSAEQAKQHEHQAAQSLAKAAAEHEAAMKELLEECKFTTEDVKATALEQQANVLRAAHIEELHKLHTEAATERKEMELNVLEPLRLELTEEQQAHLNVSRRLFLHTAAMKDLEHQVNVQSEQQKTAGAAAAAAVRALELVRSRLVDKLGEAGSTNDAEAESIFSGLQAELLARCNSMGY
eukprot:SAG31_NODE_5452_length_2531_cov_1.865954_2_plen_542_part_00